MIHARRLDIAYPTHFAVTIAEEAGFDAANTLPSVAPLVVDQKMADLPRGWVHLVSDISLDVFHATQGLSRKLAMDLGTMPSPLSINHYANTRTLLQGLVGAWLPRLFADVGASLQLGPAFVSGLMANVGAGLDEQNAVVAAIGRNEEPPPMHVRMFAALRTIARMGFADPSKTYWETWKRRLNYPKEIVIKDLDGNSAAIDASAALDITSRVVDYLISEPLEPLGGYPLAAVPSLGCDAACIDRMQKAAASLVEGNPVNAPGRIIIGAALLAVEQSPTSERRIGGVALKSLLGKGIDTAPSERRVTIEGVAPKDVIHSRELALRALAVGAALAPRNSRFRRG
jgi:hypothetical protein